MIQHNYATLLDAFITKYQATRIILLSTSLRKF